MAVNKYSIQQSQPLHLENTLLQYGNKDLSLANAFNTYREMKMDGVISGSISYIKAVVSKGGFTIGYHEKSTEAEKRVIDALNAALGDMEDYDVKRLMSNWLSMIDYGCSLNEVVLEKKGSTFVFKTISPIHLTTIEKFKFRGGKLEGVVLGSVENDGLIEDTSLAQTTISGDKLLLFRLEPDQDFPLGKSLLYGAYTSYKAKKIAEEYNLIGIAKNLSGVLDVKVPTEYITKYFADPTSDEALYVANLLDQAEMLHAGKGSYILTSSETQENGVRLFEVSTVGGNGGNAANYNVGQVIDRYNQEIMLSLQTVVLGMGAGESGGSFALADNTTNLMALFIENIRSVINSEFKKALKIAFRANGLTTERIPDLVFEEVQPLDWDEFTKGWNRLVACGSVTPTEDLEKFLRNQGNAPMADYSKRLMNDSRADESERTGDKEA